MKRFLVKKQYIIVRGLLEHSNRILVIRDTENPASLEYYELPGGYVEFGKDPVKALGAFFFQQTRIPIRVGAPFRTTSRISPHDDVHTVEIIYRVRSTQDINLGPTHITLQWIEPDDTGYFLSSRITKTIRASLR